MIKQIIIAIFVASLLLACQKNAENANGATRTAGKTEQPANSKTPDIKRYKFKSGIIEYAMTGMQTGTEIIYFDDWGWREAKYTEGEMNVAGMKQKIHKVTILDGEFTYNIDLTTNTGTKIPTPMLKELSEGAEARGEDLTDAGMRMLKQMGGKKVGEGEVAGQMCEIWEVMGAKTWLRDGLTFKTEAGFGGMGIISTATKVQTNVSVPGSKLQIPEGVTITEGQNPQDVLKMLGKKNPK